MVNSDQFFYRATGLEMEDITQEKLLLARKRKFSFSSAEEKETETKLRNERSVS